MMDTYKQIRINKRNTMIKDAERRRMTLEEFQSYLAYLKDAREAGGGFEGAKERLKFAESLLAKQKAQRETMIDKTLSQCWHDFIKATKWDDFVWWSMKIIKKILKWR